MRVKNGRDWALRSAAVTEGVADHFKAWGVSHAVLEMPGLWPGDVRSQASVESGNLLKLVYLVGQIGWLVESSHGQTYRIAPWEWKGQMSKSAVHARIMRALGRRYREHEADAVGIGLALMGVL